MTTTTCSRRMRFCAGHRVVGHEGHCRYLHGHDYTVIVTAQRRVDTLDEVGRVVDFGVLKFLDYWLTDNWDHRLLLWCDDPILAALRALPAPGVVDVPFNPTAENIASHLLHTVALDVFRPYLQHVRIVRVEVQETPNCSAACEVDRE